MAYANGTPTDVVNLLQTLVSWLVSIGWTSDKSASDGSGWEAHLHNNGVYAHFRAAVGERSWSSNNEADASGTALNMFLSTGFDGSGAWDAQPGNPPKDSGGTNVIGCGIALGNGSTPYSNYYFFSDSTADNVVVVLEKSPGLYEYLFWGASLKKAGSWTGGMYFGANSNGYYASYRFFGPNTPGFTETSPCPGSHQDFNGLATGFVRCDVDTFTGKWIGISENNSATTGFTGRNGASSVVASNPFHGGSSPTPSIPRYSHGQDSLSANPREFQYQQSSAIDGRANLLPVLWWVGRDGSSGQSGGFSLIGSLPMVFYSNGVGNGFTPTAEYTIGIDTYKLFPNFAVLKIV